jgi:hypothetical protein
MGTAWPKFMRIVFLLLSINFIIAPIVFSPPGGADNGEKTASSKRDAAARGVMHCLILASHPAGQGICLELKIHASNLIKACARRFDVSNSGPGEVPCLSHSMNALFVHHFYLGCDDDNR